MMDNGDFTVPKWGDVDCKSLEDLKTMSNADNSRCSTPASGVTDEGSLKRVTEAVLFKQLHSEIDVTKSLPVGTERLEVFIQSIVKPMLEKIHAEANKVVISYTDIADSDMRKYHQGRHILLHCPSLQELVLKLGFSKNMEELQYYLISSDRTCRLSENEALKMELRDAQSRHELVVKGLHLSLHSAEQENKHSQLTLQNNVRQSQEKLHSLEPRLKEFEEKVITLQHNLMSSNDRTQSLQKTLQAANMKIQSLQQDLDESERKAQDLQNDLRATHDDNQALQRQLGSSEENVQFLRQNTGDLENKFQFLQHNHWASEEKVKSLQQALSSSEQEASSLQQNLKSTEEKVVSLQHNYRAAEEKAQSLQQSLSSSEERAQSLQRCLRATQEKAKLLKESLRSSEEKTQTLQGALGVSESRLSMATAQQQSLDRCKEQQNERIQSLTETLTALEKQHQIIEQEMEKNLKISREKVGTLQDALDRADAMHQREVQQLQQKLNRVVKKGAATEQELHGQVSVLNCKLLTEQTKAGKEIERSLKYEGELQDTIKDLRQRLKVQTEEREFALESLKSRQKDLAEVQCLLQVDLLRCNHSSELGKGQKNLANLHQSNLKEELMTLRTGLCSVLENESGKDEQQRQDWVQVLDKSKEWEQKAEKLVDSLDSLQSHYLLLDQGEKRDQYRGGASPYTAATLSQRSPSARPISPCSYGHNSDENTFGSGSLREVKDSECLRHLQNVQKRLKKLQSADYQRNIKGLLRMS